MIIIVTKLAKKQLKLVPFHIFRKYLYWLDLLDSIGLREARKYKGFNDESLKGARKGQRSVRLSKSYRVIYREVEPDSYEVIEILEVNKHEY